MKYLIEIHHGIGDVVQMTGIIESIVKNDSNAYIALILNKEAYKSLFEKDQRIDQFFRIDFKDMTKFQIMKEVLRIRKEHFDYLLLSPISNVKASRILTLLIGAKVSFGEQLQGQGKRRKRVKIKNVHIVKRNENVLKALDSEIKVFPPRLLVDNVDVNLGVEIEDKVVALCIGTSIPQKTWSLKNYLEIADRFLALNYDVILLGGKKEANALKDLPISDKIIDLTGKLTLIQSAKVAGMCKLVLGGDTGVMHMSAAVGATTLTLFSCTDPRLHSPYSNYSYFYNIKLPCQYCYERGEVDLCSDYKCINGILVDDVYNLMKSILDGNLNRKYKFSL